MDEERLIVSLEARIRDFERNMKKAERTGTTSYQRLRRDSRRSTTAMERDMIRSTTRINQAVATTSTKIGLLGKAFAAGAIAAGTTALTRSATQAVRSLAELGQQAERAGVSVQAFQELKFVGEQNRISVDAMTDGLKELQLRADEFIVTGKGPAAEAFARLGYEARDLKRRLEDPTELFADLIGRMEDLDRAAQIRVADEIFGGSAGERFVQLLDEGERGIREMTQRAHEMGAVVDSEVIARAEELDRKFAEIQARISTMAKTAVVNLASAIQGAVSIDVDEIFGSAERAIAMLGEEGYQALRDIERLTDTQRQSAESLSDVYHGLAGDIRTLARLLDNEVAVVLEQGLDQAAVDLATITDEMRRLVTEFEAGRISAEEFEQGVSAAEERAQGLASELAAVDGQTFASVIGGISGISAALGRAFETARA
ncbi:MAG: phage tail tape measure protein, partial [Pseudomonadota bacterium]